MDSKWHSTNNTTRRGNNGHNANDKIDDFQTKTKVKTTTKSMPSDIND